MAEARREGRCGLTRILDRARDFLWRNARLLERRLFEARFEGGPRGPLVDSLRAYRNPDGGYGHALEPDLRGPDSHPIHSDFALRTLDEAGARDASLLKPLADRLARLAGPDGRVPPIFPSALEYPHAKHWDSETALLPSWNPTFAIAGRLHAYGIHHPWLDVVTENAFEALTLRSLGDAHVIQAALVFLANVPDRVRADALFDGVAAQIEGSDWFVMETPVTRYGLTPLDFAPTPIAPARHHFSRECIEAHLDDLVARQQHDGGWPIFWDPPGPAATSEWRGRWTIDALAVLQAYGRIR